MSEIIKTARDYVTDVYKVFDENRMFAEVWADKKGGEDVLAFEISWGDWKHDHLRAEYLVEKVMPVRKWETVVTEEDGSDCYSGIHYAWLGKEIDYVAELKEAMKEVE